MRGKIALVLWVTAPLLVALALPARACGPATLTLGRVQGVETTGDIRIENGPLLRLAGLHLPQGVNRETPGAGTAVAYGLLTDEPDRWGRLAAIVLLDDQAATPRLLQERWLAAGHAVARPESALGTCWPILTAAEARHARRLPVLPAEAGRFARIEGRVGRVSDGRGTTFLSVFNRDGQRTAAMIQKRYLRRFASAGIDVAGLNGQLVRIRGVRSARNALVIPLTQPEQIEIVR
jgi:hypothetical protein